jgi:hypothetical protein
MCFTHSYPYKLLTQAMDNYSEYNDPLSVGSPREAFRILASDSVFPE